MKTRAAVEAARLSIVLFASVMALMSCVPLSVFEIWDGLLDDLTPDALELSPSLLSMQVDQEVTLRASGGVVPYSFMKSLGEGSLSEIGEDVVTYTAPAGPTVAVIALRDASLVQSTAILVVTAASAEPLRILPSVASLVYGDSIDCLAVGGKEPYWFSIVSGLGTIGESTGVYIAPAADTDAVLRVEDASGQASDSTVTVRADPPDLVIDPLDLVLENGGSYTFSAMGGLGTYVYSATVGNIDAGSGAYTATAEGADTVSVTDGSDSAAATVTVMPAVDPPLAIVPASVSLVLGSADYQFHAVGGVAPYAFSMLLSVGGSITPDGLYSPAAGTKLVREFVQLEDSRGITRTATVTLKTK